MPVRSQHEQQPNSIYFITFTCYNWLPLFQLTNAYDTVYKWFDYLYRQNIRTTGYVIMPHPRLTGRAGCTCTAVLSANAKIIKYDHWKWKAVYGI